MAPSFSPSHGCFISRLDSDSNSFGFYVYPYEAYRDGVLAEEWAGSDASVTITVTGLTRITTERLLYLNLSPFS